LLPDVGTGIILTHIKEALMRLSKNWPCTVYGLTDETGEIQYVGQTRYTLNNRLKRHLTESFRGSEDAKCEWVRASVKAGRKIGIVLLEQDALWDEAETRWIAHYRQINPNLLNVMDGGSGFRKGDKRSDKTRARMADAKKKEWADPEARAKRTAGIKAERNTPEARQRLSDMQKAAWQRDEVREARISKRNVTVQGDEFREKMRQSATKQMADPEARKNIAEKNRKRFAEDPSARERSAEGARKGWADPVKRAARIEAMKRPRKPKPQETAND
jgi:GIY-YIG catalytic domain-containing protein